MTTDTAPAPTAQSPPPDERVRRSSTSARLLARPEFGAVVALVLVYLFFAIVARENNFVSWGSTAAILNAAAPLGVLAIGVSLLMIGGEFDLSIGSILGASGMLLLLLVNSPEAGGFGLGFWLALLITLAFALTVGFVNGVMVNATKLPSFIITLGSLFILRGLAVAVPRSLTNRTQLADLDLASGWPVADALFGTEFRLFGATFDVAIVWMVILAAIGTWILLRTRPGSWIFAMGGDANAARNVGVPVNRLRIALFMTTAFMGFFAALLFAMQTNSADSLRGTGVEFRSIIAVVVGGTLLTGGYGSVIGAVLGAIIFSMVQQGIIITGIDGDWFQVVLGGTLVLAVVLNNFVRQRASKR